ncbi:MAG: hypothetical protein HOA57_00820 [Candidatus Magasanikbacteria bacterium]|jgi:hypothetical protein|nr:hypothetical protein [Candidatus Magasanikbacteria bacterium]MBT4314477.1 hypothetical protein [Candidatus Magasanikbacteria bacterium]MBT4547317.1 hypothetical protein [Candidatus Magasanikbacteria bacterium]MBT6818914.1 hypothetical protein [Candidatus Magasanikbacteria bacterium]
MPDILELEEFFVEGSNQERSHVLLHITEPSNAEERKKGYFFALAEINNGPLEQIEHLQQMIDDLESGYYETDANGDKDPFEATLEYINRRGHHILQYKNSVVNCLVGVMRNHEVSFAYHGNPNVILFFKNKEGDLEQIDIMEGQESEKGTDHLFSSIIQGNVNINDYLYISTPHVTDYFTHDRVQKIINTRDTSQSAGHIQKVLKDLDSDISFGGILMHYPSDIPKTGRSSIYQEKGSDASINKLVAQEKNTKEILSPPILKGVKKKIKEYRSKEEKSPESIVKKKKGTIETNFRRRQDKGQQSIFNTILITLGKTLVLGTLGLFRLLKRILIKLGRGSILLFLLITNKDKKRHDVVRNIKNNIHEKKEAFYKLPILSKMLFVSSIVLAIVFLGSITTYKVKENWQAEKQAYHNQIQSVIDKKNAADASIIYGNNERALSLLQEAEQIVTKLPNNSKKEKDKILELSNEVDSVLMKLRKLSVVEPETIADLSQINSNVDTIKLAKIDNILLAYGEKDVSFYKINLNGNSIETKDHNNITNLVYSSTPKEQDKIVFVSGDSSVSEYNKESSLLSTKDIGFENEEVVLSGIFVYNRKLYSLDTKNNQIYRHSQTQTGYDKGASWIKDGDIDITDGVSIAIDGDLFVLKSSGEIIKLTAGKKQEFNITGLDPALDNPTQIWTYNGLQNIYILEPTNKRVIILDKEGKMLNQYTSNSWQSPTSMIVEEESKTIYILDSNKIYKFNY